jgi:hypothetical protein
MASPPRLTIRSGRYDGQRLIHGCGTQWSEDLITALKIFTSHQPRRLTCKVKLVHTTLTWPHQDGSSNSTLGVYGPIGYGAGDNDLWISVSFDPRCHPNVSYTVDLDDCQKYLGIALNGCNTDSSTAKWGGQVEARCTLWNITTRTGHDMKPPNGYPPVA